jgi:hypothetical protein
MERDMNLQEIPKVILIPKKKHFYKKKVIMMKGENEEN